MNKQQVRLLLETEFKFYSLQESAELFGERLRSLGYKPNPRIEKLYDSGLKRLNDRLRNSLRRG